MVSDKVLVYWCEMFREYNLLTGEQWGVKNAIESEMAKRRLIVPSKNNTWDEIVSYWSQNGDDLSDIKTDVLKAWYETIYPISGTVTRRDEVIEAIEKEFEKRNIQDYDVLGEGFDYWKPNTGGNTELTYISGKILGVIQVFGSVVSVLALVVIGIKYVIGSVEEKAKYKETMIPYIVGCIMLFAITNIASAIYKFATNL